MMTRSSLSDELRKRQCQYVHDSLILLKIEKMIIFIFIELIKLKLANRVFICLILARLLTATINISICSHMILYFNTFFKQFQCNDFIFKLSHKTVVQKFKSKMSRDLRQMMRQRMRQRERRMWRVKWVSRLIRAIMRKRLRRRLKAVREKKTLRKREISKNWVQIRWVQQLILFKYYHIRLYNQCSWWADCEEADN